jgi:hypothetical protein
VEEELSNETRYAGISEILSTWNWLSVDTLLLESCITKRNGIPANVLALNYMVSPLINASSINSTAIATQTEPTMKSITPISHDALNRFINTNWHIQYFFYSVMNRLQGRKETRMTEDGIWILDHTLISKLYSNKLQVLKWLKDVKGSGNWVKGYELLSLCYMDETKLYPVSFGINTPFTDKITMAIRHIKDMRALGLPIKTLVFDCWYFALDLIKALKPYKITWVTKSKSNRKFIIDGEELHANEIFGEAIAKLPGYGKVKVFKIHIDSEWVLLVTNDLKMDRETIISIYSKRMHVDNPFFRDMKSYLNLENFHTRKFTSFINHIAMRFLLYVLLVVTKIRKGIIHRSIEWVKNKLVRVVGKVRRRGNKLFVCVRKALSDTIPPPS